MKHSKQVFLTASITPLSSTVVTFPWSIREGVIDAKYHIFLFTNRHDCKMP